MAKSDRLNVKQEKFCQEHVKCGNASQAYRTVYSTEKMKDKTVWEKASRLLGTHKVRARVDEIQHHAQIRAAMTVEKLIAMHLQDRKLARKNKQAAAAIAANNSIAKLLGYMVEKSEQKVDVEHKFVVAEEAKSNVMKLISETKKEKAEPTQQIHIIEDRVH